jgi:four helix bundle protein
MKSDELKRRTFQYAIRCVRLVEALLSTTTAQVLGKQLLRCATSVGANYRAAARSRSRLDFISKMGIVEEECDETLYWIEVFNELGILSSERTQSLYSEGAEILAIIVTSIKTAKSRRERNP